MSLFKRPGGLSCRAVGRVIQSHLDGEIDATTASKVNQHLDACRRCGLDAAVWARLKSSLNRQQPTLNPESVEALRTFGRSLAASGTVPASDEPD